jgi:hypothetical protein
MVNFARIETGVVVELLATESDLSTIFHSALDWREVDTSVDIGWCLTDTGFEAPPPPSVMPQVYPTLPQLQAELTMLVARFEALIAG